MTASGYTGTDTLTYGHMDGFSGSWSQFQWLSTPSTTAFPVRVSNMKVQDVINTVSVLQSTELCHQTICACLRTHVHTYTHTHTHRAHSSQKKATGSLIYLTADSSALITVRVWHEASSCVSVDPDTFSSQYSCLFVRLTVGYDTFG